MSLANPDRTQVDTIDGTNIVSTGSVRDAQSSEVPNPQEYPVWLTEDARRVVRVALSYLAQNYFPGEETGWIREVQKKFI